MGKKYVTVKDIEKEIDSIKNYIEFWNIDLNQETERLENLNVLLDYLYKGGFCPLTKKQLLHNRELNYYILPLKTRFRMRECEEVYCKKDDLNKDDIKKDKQKNCINFTELAKEILAKDCFSDLINTCDQYEDCLIEMVCVLSKYFKEKR